MRTIIHVSDIHFGRFDQRCLEPMLEAFEAINPHLIVVSGDLTQRARKKEFKDAADLLNRLKHTHFVIPGNHDIRPFYSPIKRFTAPFDRYGEYISETLEPVYLDEELAIASIDTVRPSRIKDGRVSVAQINKTSDWFNEISKIHPKATRIVVTHHPLELPVEFPKNKLAARARQAVHKLAEAGIDMYMSGHFHQSGVGHTAKKHNIDGYSAVFVQAGTVSVRFRNELQSFNVIKITKDGIDVETHLWNPDTNKFEIKSTKTFTGSSKKWKEQNKPNKSK